MKAKHVLFSLHLLCITTFILPRINHASDLYQSSHQIASYNIWFDRDSGSTRFPIINQHLQQLDADIAFLQEVTPSFIMAYKQSDIRKYYALYQSEESERTYGQAFLSKHLLFETTSMKLTSIYNRSAFFALYPISDSQAIILINVHLESGQFESQARSEQIKEIQTQLIPEYIKQHKAGKHPYHIAGILWGGDFNIDGIEQHDRLEEFWIDSAIHQVKEEITTYTIETNPLAKQTAGFFEGSSRLDRFYLSNLAKLEATQYDVLTKFGGNDAPLSDHYPILIELKMKRFY
jgi:endonuclease/exonuclease/phosphatase family metal-dependent hydrolase